MFSSGKTSKTLKVVITINWILQLKLKVRKLHYVQLNMNSGGHFCSKDIYKKKFEGMKQSLYKFKDRLHLVTLSAELFQPFT